MIKNYYHITYKKNLKSILKNGLIPKKNDIESFNAVFLFKNKIDAEDALMNWLGDKLDEDEDIVLLKIKYDSDKVKQSAEYEVYTTETIPPKNIVDFKNI